MFQSEFRTLPLYLFSLENRREETHTEKVNQSCCFI